MKCRVCGKQAHLALRAYNTALCADDFTTFFEKRVRSTIDKYCLLGEHDKTLVAVSGGKDSLSLWSLLNKLGFAADGIHINLAIGEYSNASYEKSVQMADTLRRRLFSFSVADSFDLGIKDLARIMKRPPCSLCGTMKRYIMNRVCIDHDYGVLATGHNLDDEASALLGNILHWKEEYLWKKDVVLESEGGHLAKKIKPFFLCSEKEVAAYALLNGISYIYEECPYSVGAKTLLYKNLLNRVEETSPSTKIRFLKGYLQNAKKQRQSTGKVEEQSEPRGFCTSCGYPSYSDQCNFCRLLGRFGAGRAVSFRVYDPVTSL
jgi:tRNA-5-methyluridine54 2-sulfurtransferase